MDLGGGINKGPAWWPARVVVVMLALGFVWRIRRIASLELLHAVLKGITAVLPVGVLVAVIEFFDKP